MPEGQGEASHVALSYGSTHVPLRVGAERVRVGEVEMPLRSALVDLNRPGNFTGLPAISMPCGITQNGLPVALQFIGRRFDEAKLIAIADRFSQTARDWQAKRPPVS